MYPFDDCDISIKLDLPYIEGNNELKTILDIMMSILSSHRAKKARTLCDYIECYPVKTFDNLIIQMLQGITVNIYEADLISFTMEEIIEMMGHIDGIAIELINIFTRADMIDYIKKLVAHRENSNHTTLISYIFLATNNIKSFTEVIKFINEIYRADDIIDAIIFDACYLNNKKTIEITLDNTASLYYHTVLLYFPLDEDYFSENLLKKMDIVDVARIIHDNKDILIQMGRYEFLLMATLFRIINLYSQGTITNLHPCEPLLFDGIDYKYFEKHRTHRDFIMWLVHISNITYNPILFKYVSNTFPVEKERYYQKLI